MWGHNSHLLIITPLAIDSISDKETFDQMQVLQRRELDQELVIFPVTSIVRDFHLQTSDRPELNLPDPQRVSNK